MVIFIAILLDEHSHTHEAGAKKGSRFEIARDIPIKTVLLQLVPFSKMLPFFWRTPVLGTSRAGPVEGPPLWLDPRPEEESMHGPHGHSVGGQLGSG